MVEDKVNPLETNSFHVTEQRTNSGDLNKKRKLQADLLGLPIAKHKCWNGSSPLKCLSTLDENPEAQADGGYEHESTKDSNSFVEDSDSAMSGHGESKFQYHGPSSSSSFNWSSGSTSNYSSYSSNSTAMTEGTVGKEQFTENFDDPLMGYGSHVHDLCPGYGIDTEEQYTEREEIEGILHSGEANPNVYVLSSGRLSSINQETQRGKREPTIDQEFEQYFSELML